MPKNTQCEQFNNIPWRSKLLVLKVGESHSSMLGGVFHMYTHTNTNTNTNTKHTQKLGYLKSWMTLRLIKFYYEHAYSTGIFHYFLTQITYVRILGWLEENISQKMWIFAKHFAIEIYMYKLGIRRSSIILKFYMNGLNDNKQLQILISVIQVLKMLTNHVPHGWLTNCVKGSLLIYICSFILELLNF